VGEHWERGELTVADEHRATAVAVRIVGRLGSRFSWRGRRRGRVVLGTPPGERHSLPVAMVADLLRAEGFDVVDLGADLPVEEFVAAVVAASPVAAVAVSTTASEVLPETRALVSALRVASPAPIMVGGRAVRNGRHATDLGADGYAPDASSAAAFVETYRPRTS
jgi:methanogenic corrinoid protein MtbC1